MVAAFALVALVIVLILLWTIVRGILRSPEQVSLFFRHRRAVKGYLAITRGLIAVGTGDLRIARKAADDAARLSPGDPLALLLTAQSAQMAGDRSGAEQVFRAMTRRDDTKLLGLRGLYIEAQRRDDPQAARLAAEEAGKASPALAGRRLAEAGEQRKARNILEKAWTSNPHPDIAEAYANLRLGDSARERLARMQKLAGLMPGQLEGALAVARAALDAREFSAARAALAPYLSAAARRVATLMAEIEEAEHGDEGRVREWMARAMRASGDPVWTADGTVSDRWMPVSPSGRLDGFAWKVPLAEIGVTRPVIEMAPPPNPGDVTTPKLGVEAKPPSVRPRKTAKPAAKTKPVEPVIPLVHAPDDPGPDSALESDPVPEPTTPPPEAPWQRFIQLFR